MSIADTFLAELEFEAQTTRKFLERVPAKPDYKPHPKSMSLGRLAAHLGEAFGWGLTILNQDVFELDPSKYQPATAKDGREALAIFEKGLAEFKAALQAAPDSRLTTRWKMNVGGKTVIDLPRAAVIRSMIMNHLVHHRAQLGVYLRLNDVPVPGAYGPSADEE